MFARIVLATLLAFPATQHSVQVSRSAVPDPSQLNAGCYNVVGAGGVLPGELGIYSSPGGNTWCLGEACGRFFEGQMYYMGESFGTIDIVDLDGDGVGDVADVDFDGFPEGASHYTLERCFGSSPCASRENPFEIIIRG